MYDEIIPMKWLSADTSQSNEQATLTAPSADFWDLFMAEVVNEEDDDIGEGVHWKLIGDDIFTAVAEADTGFQLSCEIY